MNDLFSSLAELVRVFDPTEADAVDTPDVGALKLGLIDSFFALAER